MTSEPEFEWHQDKSDKNFKERGFDFDFSCRIWNGPTVEEIDNRFDYGEDRYLAFGEVDGLVLAVSYTIRNIRYRIISARKAENHERRKYYRATVPNGPPPRKGKPRGG